MVLPRITTEEELREYRAFPGDDGYNSPAAGGCWICRIGNGFNQKEIEHINIERGDVMTFDMHFDSYVHIKCLWEVGVDDLLGFERGEWKDG